MPVSVAQRARKVVAASAHWPFRLATVSDYRLAAICAAATKQLASKDGVDYGKSAGRRNYLLSPPRARAAEIAVADKADLATKPIAGLVSIMSVRSGSACVEIRITGTAAPPSIS